MTVSLPSLATLLALSIAPAAQPRPATCVQPAGCGAAPFMLVGGHGGSGGGMGGANGGGMGSAATGGTTGGMGGGNGGGMGGGTGGGMGGTSGMNGRSGSFPRQDEADPQPEASTEKLSAPQNRCVTPSGSCSFAASVAAVKGAPCHCAGEQGLGQFK